MQCGEVKELLSPYLDGAVSGTEMRSLQEHLDGCTACMREYQELRQAQRMLGSLGRVVEPGDLELKLRLAISREASAGPPWAVRRVSSEQYVEAAAATRSVTYCLVVGAELESEDPVDLVVAGGEEQDRDLAQGSDLAADLVTVTHSGEANIEDDDPGVGVVEGPGAPSHRRGRGGHGSPLS